MPTAVRLLCSSKLRSRVDQPGSSAGVHVIMCAGMELAATALFCRSSFFFFIRPRRRCGPCGRKGLRIRIFCRHACLCCLCRCRRACLLCRSCRRLLIEIQVFSFAGLGPESHTFRNLLIHLESRITLNFEVLYCVLIRALDPLFLASHRA